MGFRLNHFLALVLAPVLLASCAWFEAAEAPPPSQPATFAFGAWGDMPYAKNNDEPKMPALIADMNAADIAFSLFDGDIKDSTVPCDEASYAAAIDRFDALEKPAVYVPGDNEWTDCFHKKSGGYEPRERLAYLRRMMFSKPESFGAVTMPLQQQGKPGEKFSENTRFTYDGIVFVQLNVAGSNNNRVNGAKACLAKSQRSQQQCDADNAEVAAREIADTAWLYEGFTLARNIGAPGIVITFQADPSFEAQDEKDPDDPKLLRHSGYTRFVQDLIQLAKDFPGQVLLIHGDSHYFRLDKPLKADGRLLANVTRLETFGSPNAHWVKVTVDPKSRGVFTAQPMMVSGN